MRESRRRWPVSGSVYRAERPFHPARLLAALDDWTDLLRSKGFCRIVFIGVDPDPDEPARRLDPALLTDVELAAGPAAWRQLPDPLPLWDLDDLHDHRNHSTGPAR